MIKILITGANGQLGQSLLHLPDPEKVIDWLATDYPDPDITDRNQVETYIARSKPDFLVNCAAYTAVDQAEKEPGKAMSINGNGPGILAGACRKAGIPFIHISTDYVFAGRGCIPYLESDPVDPASVYGKSKLEGELEVIKSGSGIIVRTSWLYSEYGKNFLLTMLRLGAERESLGIVMDQVGSPTYAGDLAKGIVTMIRQIHKGDFHIGRPGIYHFCNAGVASWYDFASTIMRITGLNCKIKPIRTEEYPLPASRPAFSVMDTRKFSRDFNFDMPYWQDSMKICLENVQLQK